MANTMVNIRVDDHLKNEASRVLKNIGMTPSTAIKLFLTQIVAQGRLPLNEESFEETVTLSDETFKAYTDALQGVDVKPMPDAKTFEREMGLKVND